MPYLVRPEPRNQFLYPEEPKHVHGIPSEYYVKPIARVNGLGQDIPKGFELPGCMVDQCCEEVGLLEITVWSIDPFDAPTPRTFTLTVENTGPIPLTNLTFPAFSLAHAGLSIINGDVTIGFGPITLAPGATHTVTAVTTYQRNPDVAGTTPASLTIPISHLTSTEGVSNLATATVNFAVSHAD
mgnify:CR=1 FL=1